MRCNIATVCCQQNVTVAATTHRRQVRCAVLCWQLVAGGRWRQWMRRGRRRQRWDGERRRRRRQSGSHITVTGHSATCGGGGRRRREVSLDLTATVLTEVQPRRSHRQAAAVLASVLQCLVEVRQLTHEVEVGRDVGAHSTQELVGILQWQRHREHEIGDSDRHRTTDTSQTVYQHSHVLLPTFLYTAPPHGYSVITATQPGTCAVSTRHTSASQLPTMTVKCQQIVYNAWCINGINLSSCPLFDFVCIGSYSHLSPYGRPKHMQTAKQHSATSSCRHTLRMTAVKARQHALSL